MQSDMHLRSGAEAPPRGKRQTASAKTVESPLPSLCQLQTQGIHGVAFAIVGVTCEATYKTFANRVARNFAAAGALAKAPSWSGGRAPDGSI